MVHLYRIPVAGTSRPGWCVQAAAASKWRSSASLVASSRATIVPLVLVETLGRHRHRDGDDIAGRVAGDDAGGANAERMLLAVDGDAGLAHGFQVTQQVVEPGQRRGVRCSYSVPISAAIAALSRLAR